MSTRIYQSSDIRNKELLDDARAGLARLRATDGTSFVVLSEDRLGALEAERSSFARICQATVGLLRLEQAVVHEQVRPAGLLERGHWPWLSVFDRDELLQFMNELKDAAISATSDSSAEMVEEVLDAWRETARALRDPERHAALTVDIREEEFVEIEPR